MPRTVSKAKLNKALVEKLVAAGEKISDALADEIIATGNGAVADLIAIMKDEDLADVDSPGDGNVPVHAIRILERMQAAEAIEPMLELLGVCASGDEIYDTLILALKQFGAPVLEPALKALETADPGSEHYMALLDTLSGIGVQDERIYSALLKQLSEKPEQGALNLVEYANPAAIPHLLSELDKCKPLNEGGEAHVDQIIEIAAAVEILGGKLNKAQIKLQRGARSFQAKRRHQLNKSQKNIGYIPLTRPGVGVKLF